jgi:hypothetical protein
MVAELRKLKWTGHVTRKGVMRYAWNLKEYMKRKNKLRDQDVDGRPILRCILRV